MVIDYARVQRESPRYRAALTRATNSGDYMKVLVAVEKAYDAFDTWGAWPDDWAHWRVAAIDAYHDLQMDTPVFFGDDQKRVREIVERFGSVIQR